jgi:hypothetical protein
MKKFDPKRKVWIVQPHCHGNGGWYGYKTLSSKRGMQLKRALKINPFTEYDAYNDYDHTGRLGAPRICFSEDPNRSLFLFNGNDMRWEK